MKPRTLALTSIGGVAAATIAVLIGWQATAAAAIDGVQVFTDAEPLICTHQPTTIVGGGEDDPEGERVVAALLAEDLACELRIHVRNDSAFSTEITRVWLPFMGTDSGIPVKAVMIDGQVPSPTPALTDAEWDLDRDARLFFDEPRRLESGESFLIVATLTASDVGCMSDGTTSTIVPDGAHVVVTARTLGVTADAPYRGGSYGFVGSDSVGDCS